MRTAAEARREIARATATRARVDADIRLAKNERDANTAAALRHETAAAQQDDPAEAVLHRHEADDAKEAADAATLKIAVLANERSNLMRDEALLRHELAQAIERALATDARRL